MRTNARVLAIGGVALALGTLYLALRPAPEVAAPRSDPNYFAFVRSMEGTKPDGALTLGPGERLVVDAELGYLFDYYLAGLGEKDLGAIRTEIEHELERRLKPAPAAEAKRLLASYLDYKRALVDVEHSLARGLPLAQAARARMEAMRQLRLNYFSAEQIQGLFGQSDAYDADALARLEISGDKTLSAAARTQKLAALDARLTPAQREERDAPNRIVKMEESVLAMRAQGATDDEVYRMRAAAMSPEAAARLSDLDRDEKVWKSRIAAYLVQRNAIVGDAAKRSEADQEALLQQLRDAQFSAEEQRRLPAYE